MSHAPTILVTGFPAPRARRLVQEIARHEVGALLLLCHPDRLDEAKELVSAFPDPVRSRVELLGGDPAAIDFGLSRRAHADLGRRVEVVHAAYSVTDPEVSRDLAERVNLGSARELIELGRVAARLRRVVFYSSVFVSGNRRGRVLESELEHGQSFLSAAERSLAIAERMFKVACSPVLVLRAGHLVGDTETGQIEHLGGPYPLLLLVLSASQKASVPIPPGSEAVLALTPIDHLARTGAFLSRGEPASGTFHVIDPERLTLRAFLQMAADRCQKTLDLGYSPGLVSRALFRNPGAKVLPRHVRGIFELLVSSAEYDTKNARRLLEQGAPACPALGSYFDRLLEHARERLEHDFNAPPRPSPAPFQVA